MDLKLDTTGDLDLSSGGLELTDGADAVRQKWQIRVQFFLGEWFLDERIGVAWFQVILKKGTPLEVVRAILRRVLASTPGVRAVSKFSTVLDGATRTLRVEAEGFLEDGVEPRDPATFRFEFAPFILRDQVPPETEATA